MQELQPEMVGMLGLEVSPQPSLLSQVVRRLVTVAMLARRTQQTRMAEILAMHRQSLFDQRRQAM
jgi:hypothetical protein